MLAVFFRVFLSPLDAVGHRCWGPLWLVYAPDAGHSWWFGFALYVGVLWFTLWKISHAICLCSCLPWDWQFSVLRKKKISRFSVLLLAFCCDIRLRSNACALPYAVTLLGSYQRIFLFSFSCEIQLYYLSYKNIFGLHSAAK